MRQPLVSHEKSEIDNNIIESLILDISDHLTRSENQVK